MVRTVAKKTSCSTPGLGVFLPPPQRKHRLSYGPGPSISKTALRSFTGASEFMAPDGSTRQAGAIFTAGPTAKTKRLLFRGCHSNDPDTLELLAVIYCMLLWLVELPSLKFVNIAFRLELVTGSSTVYEWLTYWRPFPVCRQTRRLVKMALALSASMQSYGVTTDFICKPDFTNPSLTVDCHGRRLADSMARATAAGADCDVVVDISNLKLRKDWTRLTDADWLAVAQGRSPCGFELSTPTGAPSPLPLMRYEESFLEDIRRVEEEDRRL